MSQFRNDLRTEVGSILTLKGYLLTGGDMEDLLDGIEKIVVNDSAFAVTQATTDITINPPPEF